MTIENESVKSFGVQRKIDKSQLNMSDLGKGVMLNFRRVSDVLFADGVLHRSNEQSSRMLSNCILLIVRERRPARGRAVIQKLVYFSIFLCGRDSPITISFTVRDESPEVYTLESLRAKKGKKNVIEKRTWASIFEVSLLRCIATFLATYTEYEPNCKYIQLRCRKCETIGKQESDIAYVQSRRAVSLS